MKEIFRILSKVLSVQPTVGEDNMIENEDCTKLHPDILIRCKHVCIQYRQQLSTNDYQGIIASLPINQQQVLYF